MVMMINNIDHYSASSLRYAQALFELDIDELKIKKIYEAFKQVPQLLDVLTNPAISLQEKNNIIDKIFDDKLIQNFIKVLTSDNQINDIFQIIGALEQLNMKQNKTLKATLTCVVPPDDKQLKKMQDLLCKKHHCNDIKWQIIIDNSLISGFILHVDGMEYDYSLDSRLKGLKKDLTGR